jgi:hypothetical protein
MLPTKKPAWRRSAGQLLGHVAAGAVGPDGAVADLHRQIEHLVAERGQGDGRQSPRLLGRGVEIVDIGSDVGEGTTRLQPQAFVHRSVTDAEAEPEATIGQLVDVAGRLRQIPGLPEVDGLDARPELQGRGGLGHGHAEAQLIASDARAVDAGEAPAFNLGGQLRRPLPAPGHGHQ